MGKLHLKLDTQYKSFPQHYEATLEGELVIISGVNGSGKSHLLEIINNVGVVDPKKVKQRVNAKISLDGEAISHLNSIYRSFKENITIQEVTPFGVNDVLGIESQMWELFKTTKFKTVPKNSVQFTSAIERAKSFFSQRYTDEDFNALSEHEFKKEIRELDRAMELDDPFVNKIGKVFFEHALLVSRKLKEAGLLGKKIDIDTLPVAPWKLLNDILRELNLNYRFKENFTENAGILSEVPALYRLNRYGDIDDGFPVPFDALSDGEKAILSLTFSLFHQDMETKIKVLLLDEFDATLNPSLTEIFFEIIDKLFVSRGIMVVLVTHNVTTISLAPNNAVFYQVRSSHYPSQRLILSDRDDYSEMRTAHRRYVERIEEQDIKLKELASVRFKADTHRIITEGSTDWKIFVRALKFFHNKGEFLNVKPEYFIKFGNSADVESKVCGTEISIEMGNPKLKKLLTSELDSREISRRRGVFIGIFDSDETAPNIENNELFVYSVEIVPSNISVEHLFSEDEYKSKNPEGRRLFTVDEFDKNTNQLKSTKGVNYSGRLSSKPKDGKKIIDEGVFNIEGESLAMSKHEFAVAVHDGVISISDSSWENFKPIFKIVSEYISQASTSEKLEKEVSH